jgi:hypothetical protein
MRKIIKLELGLVICTLFFATAINVNGTTFKTEETRFIINEKTIFIPDTTIVIKLWDEKIDNNQILPFYSISLDGGKTVARTVQPSYELGFRYAHFDPLINTPDVPKILTAGDDTHLFIVQFVTQPLEAFNNAIESLGGHIRQYIAQFAYLVEMNKSTKLQVESLPYVRWVGPYHPAYRLEEFILENLDNANEIYPSLRYNIQVHTIEQKQIIANKIASIGGIVDKADAGKYLVVATLTPEQLFTVVRWDEINFIDRWSPLEPDMNNAREIGGANYIETVAGYDGEGVRGEVFDTGFNLAHVDFQHHPLIIHGTQGSPDSHGASTSGICFGDGTGNPKARGMLPRGQGIVAWYDYVGLTGPSRYAHTAELLQDPYYAVFQTASVGSSQTTQYTTISADSDVTLFDFDIVHCQSQSNLGNQNSRPQAWAKNIISCGGIYHYDTLTKTDDMWNYGASIGPASDGRIKPDFTHFYDKILTTTTGSSTAYTTSFGGTSGATPIIAGHVGLFFDMWSDGIFGNEVNPNGTVFENKAHMTTAKAMLINTADQYPFNGTTGDKTRMHQGWGMPNLQTMYDLREKFYIIDESDILSPFETSTHIVSVETGSPYLKITMTYADPPGNPSVQSQHRINDLTLKVTSPSHVVYWGNNGLKEGVWSTPGGNPDTKDTVECVFIENPEPGSWTIQVSADELIQDSHVETPELDADYALVVSPVLSGPKPPLINGPSEVDIGKNYEFSFVTEDPLGEDLYYFIDWGDGNTEEWIGPYPSAQAITISHTWFTKGNFSITAKAKNTIGSEGGWSIPFYITVLAPDIQIKMITGSFLKANIAITNEGGAEATNISWNLTVNCSFIICGKQSSGILPCILPVEEVKVKSNIIIGFGKTQFIVNAMEPYGSWDTRKQSGNLFLLYVKVNIGGN